MSGLDQVGSIRTYIFVGSGQVRLSQVKILSDQFGLGQVGPDQKKKNCVLRTLSTPSKSVKTSVEW